MRDLPDGVVSLSSSSGSTRPSGQAKGRQQLQAHLQGQPYPWYHVRGPMAAAITYLREWGWTTTELQRWHRAETPYMLAASIQIHLQHPWWQIEKTLLQEGRQQRIQRVASKPHHQHLLKKMSPEQQTHLKYLCCFQRFIKISQKKVSIRVSVTQTTGQLPPWAGSD